MSDHCIILIPEDPQLIPAAAKQRRARERFAAIAPEAEEIQIKATAEVEFFDCGANLERIGCPACGAELSFDWWQDRMDEDYGNGFQLAAYATPCCGAQCTLHDLVYEWPQGFSRFSLRAVNPNIGELGDKARRELETILGLKLRVIHQQI